MTALDAPLTIQSVKRRFASASDEPLQSVMGTKAKDGAIAVDKDTSSELVEKLERLVASGILTELGPEKEKS